MPPQPQTESANMLTQIIISSLLCHNDTIYKAWLKSINYFKGEHAQTQFWSNFEITKCCGDLEHQIKVISILLTLFCHQTMYLSTFCGIHPLVKKIELKNANFTVFERLVTLKIW